LRVEGAPTVPSRWLLRLDGLLRTLELEPERLHDGRWLHWQSEMDRPASVRAIDPPAPTPPVKRRPRELSVTQIESWRRDPYSIYARHILRLRALDPIDAEAGAADLGMQTHAALEAFVRRFPKDLPGDALDRLLSIGRRAFGALLHRPGVRAFWWPRFERIAAWFVEQEKLVRAEVAEVHAEVRGALTIDGPAGPFRLTAKADRIERTAKGGLRVVDYKTGVLPSDGDVGLGMSPQLPLEAAIAAQGGFTGIPAGAIESLAHWKLGGGDPPGWVKPVKGAPSELADSAIDGLRQLVNIFDEQDTPYRSVPDPDFAPRHNDYGHLARIKEWSADASGGGE
jgi:ATP-dependent helicase/nuclease subunit B